MNLSVTSTDAESTLANTTFTTRSELNNTDTILHQLSVAPGSNSYPTGDQSAVDPECQDSSQLDTNYGKYVCILSICPLL